MNRKLILGALLFVGFVASQEAKASEAMAKAKGCFVCHSVNAKVIGPAYKDVAKKYTSKDVSKLVNKVLEGGSGVWGQIPMTPNKGKVSKAEAETLVKWILSLKGKK